MLGKENMTRDGVVVYTSSGVVLPNERNHDWVKHGETVFIISVGQKGRVSVDSGSIVVNCGDDLHLPDQPGCLTVRFEPSQTKGVDDHSTLEGVYRINDPCLVKPRELVSLIDPDLARRWFGEVYEERIVAKISHNLRDLLVALVLTG